MAERRMFAKTIIDSDAFLDMPLSTQALYFHLAMRADDDGFLNNSNRIMRLIGANQNDFDLLLVKKFIIKFDDGICVIKHWRIHNYIQNDRYKETNYKKEKCTLNIDENKAYTFKDTGKKLIGNRVVDMGSAQSSNTECIQDVYKLDTQVRLGKNSIDINKKEINKEKSKPAEADRKVKKFIPPTVEEVKAYCDERNNTVDPNSFIDFYESKGWYVGKNKMKDWKAAVRTWERSRNNNTSNNKKENTFRAHI